MISQELQPGTVLFERFEIRSWLGVGESGSVYLCSDRQEENSPTALKVLNKKKTRDVDHINRFLREIDIMNKISHPNVLSCREMFFNETYLAFSMEYSNSGTLADLLADAKYLPIKIIVSTFTQLCRALNAIHRAGIIHRDIKPENILIDSEGFIKLADFGIAVESSEWYTDESGGISGTMSYVSPEYLKNGQCDERSDIYALGTILYEMITGELPFKGKSLLETIKMKVRIDPPPAVMVRSDCPEELSQIAAKAMNRDPEGRYQSMKEMINEVALACTPFQLALFSNCLSRKAA